ncbi:hypothetical protein M011DRAFT_404776 [Sporormia fimetaria CBS 119925]|uniref:Zn(2)-C6 fungal-type domain-containing protein n=1 Tax=Sporormia fimetaria CBS 119925 TaxID=1340428 RepID=A0A6A6V967_9PLEO|nr:hypothetical protein M011DRAFT_404776 [Sporormia fimetaria CBS 119925]
MLQGGSASPNPKEPHLNKSCEACRTSKVRCLPQPGLAQCQRCVKSGRSCVFAATVKRRQRKRTDARVAELEREVRHMRTLLRSNQASTSTPENTLDGSILEEADEGSRAQRSERTTSSPPAYQDPTILGESTRQPSAGAPREYIHPSTEESVMQRDPDIVDRGIISEEMAEDILRIYNSNRPPGVRIPADWSAMDLRKRKGVLFHAVMAAASRAKGKALSIPLNEEVTQLYARDLLIRGEKSVEYVQALLLTVAYPTPVGHVHGQMFRFATIAASLALELGLAMKPRRHEQLPKRTVKNLQKISSPGELLDNCRTILFLYVLFAGSSLRMRKPNMLLWNSWMEECLALLQTSPSLDDKRLVAIVQLQRIADEAFTAFGFDDASTSFSLSELRVKVILKSFERRMEHFKNSLPKDVSNPFLMIEYHSSMISLWDFAMDRGHHDAPDFANRHMTLPALDEDDVQPESLLAGSALQINAALRVIGEAQSLLDRFLEFPVPKLQASPHVVFVRCVYALVALSLKLDYAVGIDTLGLGEVLDSQSIKVDSYLSSVISLTSEAIGYQKCHTPEFWVSIFNNLKSWREEYERYLERRKAKMGEEGPDGAVQTADGAETVMTMRPIVQQSCAVPTDTTVHTQEPDLTTDPLPPSWPTYPEYPQLDPSAPPIGPATAQPENLVTMTDFESAFQNGDLYLWDGLSEAYNFNFGGAWAGTGQDPHFAYGGTGGMG